MIHMFGCILTNVYFCEQLFWSKFERDRWWYMNSNIQFVHIHI